MAYFHSWLRQANRNLTFDDGCKICMKSLLFEIENRPWKALLPPSLSPMRTHARSPARPQACVCACVRVNEFVSVCVRLRLRTHVRPRAACAEATPSTDEATTNNADSPAQKNTTNPYYPHQNCMVRNTYPTRRHPNTPRSTYWVTFTQHSIKPHLPRTPQLSTIEI